MERTALGQWSLSVWPLAATLGKIFIGKPMMNRAFENLKQKLEA